MNPAFLDEMSWEMAEVYGAISDRILINLAKYFPYFTEANLPASSFAYQAQMLAQMGKVNSETVQIIKNGLKDGDTVLKSVLEQAIISSVKANQPELLQAVRKGILTPPGFLPPVLTPNQMRAFNLYYKQSADGLNLVNTVMLESTRQAYQSTVSDIANRVQVTQTALDIGAGETITGVSSWNSAMQHSIKRMKDNGITGFIDHAGRRWSAEAYAAMDIRTTVYNTARAAVWEQNEKFGNDLYQVSNHAGARPLCYPWQCKVISSLDASRTVVDLDGNEVYVYAQSETTYGQPAGLFGINCKHYPTPFIPGVSKVREVPQDAEQNAKTYAESQKQRGLERKLREEKRDLDMLKAQNATEEVIAAQRDKCRKTSADIDEFCQETGRARHREREAVYTQRSFPSRFEYDPAQFVNEQKDVIDNWFTSGGSQQRFTAGKMIPVKPIMPNPVQTPPVNVAPQATTPQATANTMNYGNAFDGGRTAQQKQLFADAKDALTNAPENTRKLWEKVAPELNTPITGRGGTYYKPSGLGKGKGNVHFKSYADGFAESSYQRKNYVFFHEFGHNIDDLLGGQHGKKSEYFSVTYKGGIFGKTIRQECEDAVKAFYAQSGMTVPITDRSVGKAFAEWVKKTYTIYERGDISDMFERYMIDNYGMQFPFGVGHGRKYHSNINSTPIEAFAEMFGSTVTGCDSLPVIKQFFPQSYKIFEEMIGSVI